MLGGGTSSGELRHLILCVSKASPKASALNHYQADEEEQAYLKAQSDPAQLRKA